MNTEAPSSIVPPYISYSTFSNFISGLADHRQLPTHIDKSLMAKMSGSGQSALTAALKALRLINDETEPQPLLSKLVYASPEDRKSSLQAVVKTTYSFLFDDGFSIANTTSKQVEARFREYANATGGTLPRCISFFLSIAKDAEIAVSPHVKAPAAIKTTGAAKKKKASPAPDIQGVQKEKDSEKEREKIHEPLKGREGMTRFDIPLKDTENGIIYLPEGLTDAQAIKAVKMANFILRSYYEIDGD